MPPVGPRKLLIAAIGVATVNYVATACHETPTSGNLPAPQTAEPIPVAGNLPAPPPQDAAPPTPPASAVIIPPAAGNLAPPPSFDAGAKPKDAGAKK